MPNALHIPHLFYTNTIVQKHNKIVLNTTVGPTFNFEVLHIIICMQQNMLIELCVGNYATFDGLVNGANGIFKIVVSYHNKTIIWISFPIKKIGVLVRKKSIHFYTKIIQLNRTPIVPIIKGIRIDKN
jgi:hypothetical protein